MGPRRAAIFALRRRLTGRVAPVSRLNEDRANGSGRTGEFARCPNATSFERTVIQTQCHSTNISSFAESSTWAYCSQRES